ncbi:MAG TPA: prolyl oligopeptidase family serine peptidase [Pirellulales bacterium]|nr:prolyl oligopeptidase family serine peptidase [Pirellulales bacterium]
MVNLPVSPAKADEPADPLRPPAIATEDVPAVPPELAERLRQYQNTRSAAFAGWAPDGRGVLVQTRFGNSVQLHRVYEPGGRREQVTFFDEPAGGRFIPEAHDGSLLVTMSRGGSENNQVYYLDQSAYRTTLLTDGKSRNDLGPVRRDGRQMIVHSNRRNGRDTDLYRADCRQAGSLELLMETKGEFWQAADWSLDGKQLLLARYVSINESYPALFDLAAKKLAPIDLPAEGPAAVGDLGFSPDGRSAYLTTDARGEFLELAKLDLKSKEYSWPAGDLRWDVSDLEVDPKTGRVAYTTNEDGASALYLLEGDRPRKLVVPLGIVANLDFSPDGAQLGFTLARPEAPAEAYSIELGSDKHDGDKDDQLVRWTYSEVGGLDPESFVKPEHIQFRSFDGRQIPGYCFRPRGASPKRPAAVLVRIHGGPESQFRPFFSGTTQFEVNELGLAVVYPNVRGSAGYGKTYLKLDNAEKREDSVKDIGALLGWIAQQPELDAQRVAVTGGSYGGFMVLSSLTHYPERIKAGIDIVGIANFVTFLERTSPYRQDLRRAEYGDERDPKMREVFERINPSSSADTIRSALLVAHGRNDPRVPFFEAEQIAAKVRAAGRQVWTVYADNEGHGFGKKDNRDYITAVEMMFLEKYLDLSAKE